MRKTGTHRALCVAALWLALIAMVFAYTDREAFSWRYEGEEVALIWESGAQADEAQARAQADLQARRQQIADRARAGIWDEDGAYADEENVMLPARVEDEPGLNLMWGEYEATIWYVSEEGFDVRAAAAGRQAFVREGRASLPAVPQGGTGTWTFALSDGAPGVMLAGDLPQGAQVTAARVRKLGADVFSPDLMAYALLAGAVLTALLALTWDERPGARERRRDAMILVCAALFVSAPSLTGALLNGHDLFFHLNRVEGIASGLRAGQFPVRIHASTLLGYGYAAPEFYPELFLYIPAAMRNLGVSQAACLSVCQIVLNLLTALLCYVSARRLFASRRVAVGAAVLYTLSIYRVANLYVRASIGESAALMFAPLLIAALYDVLAGDERRWPLLCAAMLGVFMNHLLSTLFSACICAIAALVSLPRLLREKKRLLAIAKAAALTALCSLWFLVPLLQYGAAGINTNVLFDSTVALLSPGSLLVAFSGNPAAAVLEDQDFAYHIGTVPGAAILAGCAALLVRRYARGGLRKEKPSAAEDGGRERLALFLLALGGAALLCATPLFPWSRAITVRKPISTLFMQIQFPWRLAGVATPLLSLAAAYGYLGEERHAPAGMAALLALNVVLCGYTVTTILGRGPVYESDLFCDTRIEQYEYLYVGTHKSLLEPGHIDIAGGKGEVVSFEKNGTTLQAEIAIEDGEGCAYFEVPMLYYPGYRASINGAPVEAKRGENNVIRVVNTSTIPQIALRVWFEPPVSWLIAQGASLLGAALLCAALLRARRKGA